MCLNLAAARLRAELPSGKAPTTRVRRRISRMMRSSGLLDADAAPTLLGKRVVRQGLRHGRLHQPRRLAEPHAVELSDDLAGLAPSRFQIFSWAWMALSSNATSQLAGPHVAEDVAIEMHHAALPPGLGTELGGTLATTPHASEMISFTPARPRPLRWLRKALPPALSSFAPSTIPSNLAVALIIDRDRHPQRHVAHLACPAVLERDTVEIEIGIGTLALDRLVPPGSIWP